MKLANFPLKNSIVLAIVLLLSGTAWAAQLINVTGNGVELTYVSVDCADENEVGIVVAGATFVGTNLSVQNCAAGGFAFNGATPTLTNSLGLSAGDDVAIADGVTLTGTYNLFGDAAEAGDGTYSDGGSTSLWSASYADRIDAGIAWMTYAQAQAAGIVIYGTKPDIGFEEFVSQRSAPIGKKLFWLEEDDFCSSENTNCYLVMGGDTWQGILMTWQGASVIW